MSAIIFPDRLIDRLQAMLPEDKAFAQPVSELEIWLGAPKGQIRAACRTLQRYKLADAELRPRATPTQRRPTLYWWGIRP